MPRRCASALAAAAPAGPAKIVAMTHTIDLVHLHVPPAQAHAALQSCKIGGTLVIGGVPPLLDAGEANHLILGAVRNAFRISLLARMVVGAGVAHSGDANGVSRGFQRRPYS